MNSPRIAILIHELDPPDGAYFLYEMAKLWQTAGINVTIHAGLRFLNEIDLAIVHVDLTCVPWDYQQSYRQYPRIINSSITDISKRCISRHLLHSPEDKWQGPVVVKTNRNYGGIPELLRFGPKEKHRFKDLLLDYRIYTTPWQVPSDVWLLQDWVVEQFLPERVGDFYCLRTWMFLGDAYTHSLSYSYNPIVKSGSVIKRDELGAPPAELIAIRKSLGMEYGKFDYALVNGSVVLYDVNKTPAFGNLNPEQVRLRLPNLARGINSLLGGGL